MFPVFPSGLFPSEEPQSRQDNALVFILHNIFILLVVFCTLVMPVEGATC